MKVNKYCTMLNEQRTEYLASNGYAQAKSCTPLNRAETIAEFLINTYSANELPEERLWLICLSSSLRLIGSFEIARGSADTCIADPRVIYKNALMAGAVNIIIAHCHPSGDSKPSGKDLALTERLIKCGDILNVPLLDHIIIGDNYISLLENFPHLWERKENV